MYGYCWEKLHVNQLLCILEKMLQFCTFLFNVYSDGDVYEGDWVNDLRQGHGIMKFVDGTIYGVRKKNFFPLPVVEIFIIVKKFNKCCSQ